MAVFSLNPEPTVHTDLERGTKADLSHRESTHGGIIQGYSQIFV